MLSDKLIQFLESSLTLATKSADVLIDELLTYLVIYASLKILVTVIVVGFLYSVISKGVKYCRTCATESDATGKRVNTLWAGALATLRAGLLVGAIVYSFAGIKDIVKICAAPNIYLIETGLSLLNKQKEGQQ